MKVDYFKSVLAKTPIERPKDALFYLERIRIGAVKQQVDKLRASINKDEKKALKSALPCVAFAGTFTHRAKDALKKASGLLILDFDHVNIDELKTKITDKPECFSCWVSPSGDGLKALFRIPLVENSDEYTNLFNDLTQYYGFDCDKSGKDISRLCFESYDPDIYINIEAKTYEPTALSTPVEVATLGCITNIPLLDNDEIANRLMTWFKTKYNNKERNSSLFKLAIAFNDFGVDQLNAYRYLYYFEQSDFNRKEIDTIIRSAYKHTANFGTKQFEDSAKRKNIENRILRGKKNAEIINEFSEIPSEKLETEITLIRNSVKVDEFWRYNRKGEIEIQPYRFKIYLESLNYFKYYPNGKTKTFIFIKKDGKFVDALTEFQIKDDVLSRLVADDRIDAFDCAADKTRIFSSNYLNLIDTAQITIQRDTYDYAMLYYQNVAVRVYRDKVETISYDDFNDFVWKNTVIERNFVNVDHHNSQFRSFIWYCAGQSVEKYNTLKSVIGYLLHSHKTSSNNKAIILNDETISDTPNGGSGKGIIINSIGHMKRLSVIDGKTFDFGKSFPFQTVSTDTQVLAFDDVKKSFEFERLFSVITEGITIEYKGKDAIKIPVQDSPKILISTNYTIKADGGSFKRRMFEVEMSNYFNANHTPIEQFGNLLFDEWGEKEWQLFDKFMINCLQYYLQNGLVTSTAKNLALRKFINETSQEFYEYALIERQIESDIRITKSDFLDKYHAEYPDSKKFVTIRTMVKWIKKYCEYQNINYSEGNTNGSRWFTIGEQPEKTTVKLIDECPF